MTSEPDGKAARRPPTIDLTATDVERPASASRLKSHAIGAAFGALATAAIVAGLWFAGIAPERQAVPLGGAAPAAGLGDEVAARLGRYRFYGHSNVLFTGSICQIRPPQGRL